MLMRRSTFAVVAACAALMALTARAGAQEEVFNLTFDGPPNPNYNYAYDYSGGGNPQTDHSAFSSATASFIGGGRNGGNAFNVTGDFTNVPVMPDYNYKGIGGGVGYFRYDFQTGTTFGLPSGNLADYTFTVDLSGAGYDTAESSIIEFQMLVPDDRITPDADTDFDPFATVRFERPGFGATYETVTLRLDQGTLSFNEARVPAGERDFSRHAADVGLLNLQFQLQANFGNDSDNRLFADNIRLTVVPEPAAALLLPALLALATTRRPRRRAGAGR